MDPAQARLRRRPGRRPPAPGDGRGPRPLPQGPARSGPPSFAALDLGTNNCRLLVAEPDDGGFRVVDAFSRIVRLGEGLERTGRLAEGAMDRTVGALRVCAAKIARRGVIGLRNVATEACRRAANCEQFLRRVRDETGLEFEIISTEEEARLALAGCSPLLVPGFTHGIVFDIGGGSTEVSWIETPGTQDLRVAETLSIPVGVVNLSEIHGGGEVTGQQFEAMVEVIAGTLAPFDERNRISAAVAEGCVQMLGTSGTVTTLAGIHLGLPAYDRSRVDGAFMDFADVASVTRHLMALDHRGRVREPCVGAARADLVVAGCAILEAICRTWAVGRLRVADRGVREGILLGLMERAARPVPGGE